MTTTLDTSVDDSDFAYEAGEVLHGFTGGNIAGDLIAGLLAGKLAGEWTPAPTRAELPDRLTLISEALDEAAAYLTAYAVRARSLADHVRTHDSLHGDDGEYVPLPPRP